MLHKMVQYIKISRNVAIYFGVMTLRSFSDWYILCEMLRSQILVVTM